jgi:hypothetical protein
MPSTPTPSKRAGTLARALLAELSSDSSDDMQLTPTPHAKKRILSVSEDELESTASQSISTSNVVSTDQFIPRPKSQRTRIAPAEYRANVFLSPQIIISREYMTCQEKHLPVKKSGETLQVLK